MVSTHGIRYAINLMINELRSKYYLELRNTHQFDNAFQRGFVFLNRKNIDLREIRKNAIQMYYKEVISPNLRSVITDANLMKTNRIYLCGGAMYYQDWSIVSTRNSAVLPNFRFWIIRRHWRSRGYALNSLRRQTEKRNRLSVLI
jgi:hypothetical protein